jgi:hypothetical protein
MTKSFRWVESLSPDPRLNLYRKYYHEYDINISIKFYHTIISYAVRDCWWNVGNFKRRDPNSDANRSEYSRLNKLVKKSSKSDDNNRALRMADDLEEAARKGQQREVWQKIYVISEKKKKLSALSSCER